jgi:hypothetical protein
MAAAMAMPTTKGSLQVLSPANGQLITTADIPAKVAVSNFRISRENVGRPDVDGEGHIHVMLDGMTMGKLFNFYTAPDFTLEGRGITPGEHTLIFDLASNTHEDFANTVQKVAINYQPRKPEVLPSQAAGGPPTVKIVSPRDSATVRPRFTMRVQPTNFRPAYDLEGKPNIPGFGHYHVFVDMDMKAMEMPGGMMSMAGMVDMPGSNTIPLDLTAWPDGQHTITVETVQNDHTEIPGAKPAMISVNLRH